MGAPRTQEGTMRMRSRLALVMAMAMLAVAVGAVTASADVDRYQFEESTYLLHLDYNDAHYYHEYTVTLDQSTGEYEYTGAYLGNTFPGSVQWMEMVSDWVETDTTIGFRADYLDEFGLLTGYWFTFLGNFDGVDTWDGTGASASQTFDTMALARTGVETSDYNHGQYVKEADDKKAAAHSLIGMPKNAKKNK